MPSVRVLGLSGAVLLAGVTVANAADVGVRPPAINPPPPAAAVPAGYDWSGAYVGLSGGYGWSNFGSDATVSSGNGWLGGGYVGYNMQFASNLVIGIEADAMWSGISGTSGGSSADINWIGTVRGRAGYAFDRFLVYGTGGLALGGVELNDGSSSAKNMHTGWTVGAGVETAISNNMTARLEYDYVKFGSETYSLGSTYTTGPSAHVVKVGLGFKF